MQIIGDNIANVNTVAFKQSTFTFQDLLSQETATMSGTSQVGRGTALGDVYSSFSQGSFESTGSPTDLAIGGDGFFVLGESGNTSSLYYSRAGNFRFDKDGNFVNPEGYVVKGYELDENENNASGVVDITLSSFSSPPDETDEIKVILNLDSSSTSGSNTLTLAWDGDNATKSYISDSSFEYQSTLVAYDSLGNPHDVSAYFDKGGTDGVWEYIITCDPLEDNRGFSGNTLGLLARGTITFNPASGAIEDDGLTMDICGAAAWSTPGVNSNGYFEFAPTFITGSAMAIEFDIGTKWDSAGSPAAFVNDTLTTTQYSKASSTTFQSSNGYAAGSLRGVSVDVDGVMTGSYSNGQLVPLHRVALAKFQNNQGLYKVGGNLFTETRESGVAFPANPGTSGLGTIAPNSLEQSNVDLANEFVKMITTQRGFQANSKIITVTDQMLAELINLKR
jgi:flagellar hook protein FlgE